MKLLEKLRQITGGAPRRAERQPRRERRRDPDWASLPGGSSAREAADATPARARELAD